jgi:DNA-binding HxlR family transcriptional regulator
VEIHDWAAPTMAVMPAADRTTETALGAALSRVGDRWSLLVVDALLLAPRRFNDLQEAVPGIAANILTDRLRRLEREGVVVATAYSTRPPRMEYSLSADGRELAGALRLLADWGGRRGLGGPDQHEPLRHAACGTPLEARWYCPTCSSAVREDEAPETRQI